jgi:DNA polymerase-3 subunit alpha
LIEAGSFDAFIPNVTQNLAARMRESSDELATPKALTHPGGQVLSHVEYSGEGWTRDAMRESVDAMYSASQRDQKESALGVLNLFSLIEDTEKPFLAPPPVFRPSTKAQLLHREKELLGFYLTGHPMDDYKDVLRHLSCVAFSEFETLPEGAVIRAAFVVEALQVKVSNKTQKKFAILTISDGLDRFELPVWSELFEEKSAIIRENNLLYGIISVERKNGNINLSCRSLDELASIDEAKIKACDEVYDRLKAKIMAEAKWREKKMMATEKSQPESSKEAVLPTAIKVRVDADRMRMSEVLAMKELFRAHPGSSPLEVHFYSGDKRLGIINIDASWGVKVDPAFQAKLQALQEQMACRAH